MKSLEDAFRAAKVHYNWPVSRLIEAAIVRGEGILTAQGAFRATTGQYTGRSPKDKFIVDEPAAQHVHWGDVNRPLSSEHFERLYQDVMRYVGENEWFCFQGFAGADPAYRLPIQVFTEFAWHNLFARQLFIRPSREELADFNAQFTVVAAPRFKADPRIHGTRSETFIVLSFARRVVLIGGTEYAGEIKKSIFTVMNYLLPQQGVFPMHCSANIGPKDDVTLFFGLSGTGKTTLSADVGRRLIGDDEHGWSDRGVFNIEGGCYAKCIHLSAEHEPEIYNAIRYGAVLENVVVDEATREPDYDDASLTENTRAAYPVDFIEGAVIPGVGGHPNVIIFLTADAFGVLPPVAKLTKEQAMYHFLSGYTSKLAGTERGVTEPQATFSACFGSPFLPMDPNVYAKMLGEKIERHNTRVYLVNTGWSGRPYGVGERIKLRYTRAMVRAAIEGVLDEVETVVDPVFGLQIPVRCPDVPDTVLNPRATWSDGAAYDRQVRELALRFRDNFEKIAHLAPELKDVGPKII